MQSVEEERNVYRHLFLCLVQFGTRGKYPSFSCKDFSLTVFKCRFMLVSFFNSIHESVLCQSNNRRQARHCSRLNHDQSEGVGFGVCRVGSKCV
jgi:hypothetical protein